MSEHRRDYISIKAGAPVRNIDFARDETLSYDLNTFGWNHDGSTTSYMFRRYNGDAGDVVYRVELPYFQILPCHRRFLQEQLESNLIKRLDTQGLQQTILNPPRTHSNGIQFMGPVLSPHLAYYECIAIWPHLTEALKQALILSDGEAGSCIRSYRSGLQFGSEAISHSGGTPLDAIVRAVEYASMMVTRRPGAGTEIVYATFDQNLGVFDLNALDRWMKFLREEYERIYG